MDMQVQELKTVTIERWYSSLNERITFNTLILRVRWKIEQVINQEVIELLQGGNGFSRIGCINVIGERLFSLTITDKKTMPKSVNEIAKYVFAEVGFQLWQDRLLEKVAKIYPETRDKYDVKIPFAVLNQISDDFLLDGLEKEGSDILSRLINWKSWTQNPKFK